MTGTIFHVNKERQMFSVITEIGFVVFELIDTSELSINDIIEGDCTNCGLTALFNKTTGNKFSVFIEQIGATEVSAKKGCFIL